MVCKAEFHLAMFKLLLGYRTLIVTGLPTLIKSSNDEWSRTRGQFVGCDCLASSVDVPRRGTYGK